MHVRHIHAKAKAGQLDELLRTVREDIMPVVSERPGFQRLTVLVDRGTETLVSMSFWATEDDLTAADKDGFVQEQLGKIQSLVAEAPQITKLEVAAER
jgi:heme-degrading monooxygenase HmoA